MSGNFKGFAMLRQMTLAQPDKLMPGWDTQHKPQPVYVEVSLPAIALGYLVPCGSVSYCGWLHMCRKRDLFVSVQGYGFVPPSQVRISHLEVWSGLPVRQAGAKISVCGWPPPMVCMIAAQ